MTRPREFLPDQTHVIRHRVVDFRCGLAPREVQEVLMYCFACASRKFEQIGAHAITVSPDGVEFVITDRLMPGTDVEDWESAVPGFTCLFFRMVAQFCNDRYERTGQGFWRQLPYQPTSLEDEASRWQAVVDLALYPIQRALAANTNAYPGYNLGPGDVGRTLRFQKPDFRFDYVANVDQPDEVDLTFDPLPGHDDPREYRREFRRRRDAAEQQLVADGLPERTLTRADVRELTFDDRLDQTSAELDYFPPRNGNDDQNVYAADPRIEQRARERRRAFHADYDDAWNVLRGKNWETWPDVVFPFGTFLYRVRLRVHVRYPELRAAV